MRKCCWKSTGKRQGPGCAGMQRQALLHFRKLAPARSFRCRPQRKGFAPNSHAPCNRRAFRAARGIWVAGTRSCSERRPRAGAAFRKAERRGPRRERRRNFARNSREAMRSSRREAPARAAAIRAAKRSPWRPGEAQVVLLRRIGPLRAYCITGRAGLPGFARDWENRNSCDLILPEGQGAAGARSLCGATHRLGSRIRSRRQGRPWPQPRGTAPRPHWQARS